MKFAVIADTHFGCRQDAQVFLDYFFRFFEEIFFPYLKEHGIKDVIHLGDLVDRRKYINFRVLHEMNTRVIHRFAEEGLTLHIISGNHDTTDLAGSDIQRH